MPASDRKLRVFLCHASQDKPIVRELYQRLNAEGWIDPWLDEEKLLPGQNWDLEIEKAVESTDVVIVCLSNNSVNKEGYLQKEIRKVLDTSGEMPEGTIFIIPVRLDDCEVPRTLHLFHYIDFFPAEQVKKSYYRLQKSLSIRADSLNLEIKDKAQTTKFLDKTKNFRFNRNDIRIGLWAPTNAGKTVYLLSLYIASMRKGSDWLVGFDENTSMQRRQFILGSADALRQGEWPPVTKVKPDPELYGLVFYPAPRLPKPEIKNIGNDSLVSFWKFFTEEFDDSKKETGIQISLTDISGESYLNEPVDNHLWQHLAGCNGIICLLDPSDIKSQIRITTNLVDFLYAKVKKEKPDVIIDGQYLPHHIAVCFTKMERPEWLPMLNSPEDVIEKVNQNIDLDIRRLLWVHFAPERLSFHCISSVGTDYLETGLLKPINVFAPFNEWITSR